MMHKRSRRRSEEILFTQKRKKRKTQKNRLNFFGWSLVTCSFFFLGWTVYSSGQDVAETFNEKLKMESCKFILLACPSYYLSDQNQQGSTDNEIKMTVVDSIKMVQRWFKQIPKQRPNEKLQRIFHTEGNMYKVETNVATYEVNVIGKTVDSYSVTIKDNR